MYWGDREPDPRPTENDQPRTSGGLFGCLVLVVGGVAAVATTAGAVLTGGTPF